MLKEGLHLEWKRRLPNLLGKKLSTIYFGGGTPTQLPFSFIKDLMVLIQKTHSLPSEITIEANPEDITLDLLKSYRRLCITRLSIGVQSFDNPTLKTLGRVHTAQKAEKAIHTAYDAGFNNISIDLMYDLPNQTLDSWQHTLNITKTLPISHISLYNLTFEEPSAFHRKQKTLLPTLPPEEASLKMFNRAHETFESMGLERYEISAYGQTSDHNLGYWCGRPFLGFGPSAFSYWDKSRFRNMANLPKYTLALKQNLPCEDFTERLNPAAHAREMLAINLRILHGVHLPTFDHTIDPALQKDIDSLIADGLLQECDEVLLLTERGRLFYDTVATIIV